MLIYKPSGVSSFVNYRLISTLHYHLWALVGLNCHGTAVRICKLMFMLRLLCTATEVFKSLTMLS